jgi:hypothetical protein
MEIEGSQEAIRIEFQIRLDSMQRLLGHKKRSLHRPVMPPEAHHVTRGIITAAEIWEIKGHDSIRYRSPTLLEAG